MPATLLLTAALVFSPENARLACDTAKGLVESCTPRDAGTIRGRLAANWILDAASVTGADVRRDIFRAESPTGPRDFVNLYAEFKANATGRWVVVVSHYDTKPGVPCPGANDGASTSGLLVALCDALCQWRTPKGNVMLVWTDAEECVSQYSENDGLQGARRAVQYLREKERPVQAVLCLDMLGDRDLAISIPANGTPTLAKIAVHAARRAGMAGLVRRIDEHVKDDHVPFLDAGYPAIDLIDFEYGSAPGLNDFWHTREDTVAHISEASLLKSGRLVAEMLNLLL